MQRQYIADDIRIERIGGAFRAVIHSNGKLVAEIVLDRSVGLLAVQRFLAQIEADDGAPVNVVAFPVPHADTA